MKIGHSRRRRARSGTTGAINERRAVKLVVLAWPAVSPPLDNPYVNCLYEAVRNEGIEVKNFSWWRALTDEFDVLHMHWPDWVLRNSGLTKSLLKLAALTVIVARAQIVGAAVVWTVHNLHPHDFHGPVRERLLYCLLARVVDVQIHLSAATEKVMRLENHPARGGSVTVIPHGLYPLPQGFRESRSAAKHSARISFLGTVGPYKGVTRLLSEVKALTGSVNLLIAGQPISHSYAEEVRASAAAVDDVELVLHRLTEDEYYTFLSKTDLAVYPFVSGLNSGAVIKALGAGVPVLVPRTLTFEELRDTFRSVWVQCYDGELNAEILEAAIQVIQDAPLAPPNLPDWDWTSIGLKTANLYR